VSQAVVIDGQPIGRVQPRAIPRTAADGTLILRLDDRGDPDAAGDWGSFAGRSCGSTRMARCRPISRRRLPIYVEACIDPWRWSGRVPRRSGWRINRRRKRGARAPARVDGERPDRSAVLAAGLDDVGGAFAASRSRGRRSRRRPAGCLQPRWTGPPDRRGGQGELESSEWWPTGELEPIRAGLHARGCLRPDVRRDRPARPPLPTHSLR
jgi:hypothetical protein